MVKLPVLAVISLLASLVDAHSSGSANHARFSKNRLDRRQDTLASRVRVAAINLNLTSATSSGDRSAISNKINRPNANVANAGNTTACTIAPGLDYSVIDRIKKNLAETAMDSWVAGTQAEALLELDAPFSSVFSPSYNVSGDTADDLDAIVDIANIWLSKLGPDAQQLVDVQGGAAGDAASIGVAFYTASSVAKADDDGYGKYLERQKEYLLKQLPRDPETGAISHRPNNEPFQAWSDWVYMVPPFLSQYAVLHNDLWLARETHNQIKGYRTILRETETNLWRHVKRGNWEDDKLWSTGIGWTLAGIVRSYATLYHSQFRSELESELSDMAKWANQIIAAVLQRVNPDSNLLPNVYEQEDTFDDSASTALILSAIYRAASLDILDNRDSSIETAERIRQAVYNKVTPHTSWLASTADPLEFHVSTDRSPEGQAFLLLLQAAVRDYKC